MSAALPSAAFSAHAPDLIRLRRFSAIIPRCIVIGASTGGPQALGTFLHGIAPFLGAVPVVIVLHMPAGFSAPVSVNTARITGLDASVARHAERLEPGRVYFAAGGTHTKLIRFGDDAMLVHADTPPVHFCRPAADVLFHSAADTFRAGVLGIVLTGMGTDGLAGATAIADGGGSIIAQDEASSVVWGMPGAVARAGLCSAVLPIEAIAGTVASLLRGVSAIPRP